MGASNLAIFVFSMRFFYLWYSSNIKIFKEKWSHVILVAKRYSTLFFVAFSCFAFAKCIFELHELARRLSWLGSNILTHSAFSRILIPVILAICVCSTNNAKICKYILFIRITLFCPVRWSWRSTKSVSLVETPAYLVLFCFKSNTEG